MIGNRISLAGISVSIYLSDLLKLEIFQDKARKMHRFMYGSYAVFITAFSFFIWAWAEYIYDVLNFLFMFVFVFMVYGPFLTYTRRSYLRLRARQETDKQYLTAMLSLEAMSLCNIMVFLFFLFENIRLSLLSSEGFTIFYYLAWACFIGSVIGIYLGYYRPAKKN